MLGVQHDSIDSVVCITGFSEVFIVISMFGLLSSTKSWLVAMLGLSELACP
jgi:hypothetical protein